MAIYLVGKDDLNRYPGKRFNIANGRIDGCPDRVSCLAPEMHNVLGLYSYRGIPKFAHNDPVSLTQFIADYRQLVVHERIRVVRPFVASLKPDDDQVFACHCTRLPQEYLFALPEPTEDACKKWFCHRLLVYYLLRSWRPDLDVILR